MLTKEKPAHIVDFLGRNRNKIKQWFVMENNIPIGIIKEIPNNPNGYYDPCAIYIHWVGGHIHLRPFAGKGEWREDIKYRLKGIKGATLHKGN